MKSNTPELMKFKRLQRRLKVNVAELCGLLELLWISTSKNAPQGDIGRFSNEEIAIGCYWEGDPDEFVASLVECGWLDEDDEYRLLVHDWADHAPRWVVGNLKRYGKSIIEPNAKQEENSTKQPTKEATKQPTNEPAIGPSSKSSQVKPSQAKPSESSSELLSNPPPSPSRSERFNQAWDRWRAHRNENFQRLTPTSEDAALMELARCFPDDEDEQIAAIDFSILRGAKNLITNGDHRARAAPRDSPKTHDRAARRAEMLSKIGTV